MDVNEDVRIHDSAFKHGLSPEAITHAWSTGVQRQLRIEDDQPERYLRIGVDQAGRPIELVALVFDQQRTLIIHAMPARKSTLKATERKRR